MVLGEDWAYFYVMKAGSTTLLHALREKGEYRHWTFPEIPRNRIKPLHFTVVRNPYARAVSLWAQNYRTLKFEEFCRKRLRTGDHPKNKWMFWDQHRWLSHFVIDKILHLENIEEELKPIVGKVNLPMLNKTDHEPWIELMSHEAVNIINEWAKNDFQYGYDILQSETGMAYRQSKRVTRR